MNSLNPKKAVSLALALAAIALTATACSGSDGGATSASCSGIPNGLTPSGTGRNAYTMILRVNTGKQAEQFAADPLRSRIRDRDLFLINTEYKTMNTGEAEDIFSSLRSKFPCNRIVSLNGLGKIPGKPGYMYTLAGESGLAAVVLDWERDTWEEARDGAWSEEESVNLERVSVETKSVANQIDEGGTGSASTRAGLATQFRSDWDYAKFGKKLAQINWRLNEEFRGYQVVQSQNRCRGTSDSASLADLARRLRSQYASLIDGEPGPNGWQKASEPQREILTHLGFEISFTTKPKPGETLPVDTDSSSDAADCTAAVLKVGGTAFIYWATPAAVEEMLASDLGRKFRPAD